MEPRLEFSWALPEEQNEILHFISSSYGENSIQAIPGRCSWLYFENPLGLHISTCRTDGKLIAVCGHLPQKISLRSEVVQAGFGIDFFVDKDWRRLGIGQEFLKMRLERFALSLSLGQSDSMRSLYRNQKAIDLGPLQFAVHRSGPSFSGNMKSLARNNLAWAKGLFRHPSQNHPALQPVSVAEAAPYADDPGWFQWRYGSKPYGDYSIWLSASDQETSIVVARNIKSHNEIVDLQTSPTNRVNLLAQAARLGINSETQMTFFGNGMRNDGLRAGFWIRPHRAHVIAMASEERLTRLLEQGEIQITSGSADAEILRYPEGN